MEGTDQMHVYALYLRFAMKPRVEITWIFEQKKQNMDREQRIQRKQEYRTACSVLSFFCKDKGRVQNI